MTTIVGVRKDNVIVVASDRGINSVETRLHTTCKLIDVQDELKTVIGLSGSLNSLQALNRILAELELTFEGDLAIYDSLRMIHDEMKTNHHLVVASDDETNAEASPFTLVIANRTGLYYTTSYRDVIRADDGLCAIGSGREFAIGSLATNQSTDPRVVARSAVAVASSYDFATWGGIDDRVIKC